MTESIPLQAPLVGLQMDSDTAQYVGMLEGTIAALVINEVKYRTLLELLTGDSWEAVKVGPEPDAIVTLAVSTLMKQTNMDEYKARKLIALRWANHNNDSGSVVPQGITGTTTPRATRPDTVVTPSMADRFKSWKARQEQAASELVSANQSVESQSTESGTSVPESQPT
jgi:hypothetical protein